VFGLVVVLRTGSQTGPPIAIAERWGRRAVSPGYAGADPPELHHLLGRCWCRWSGLWDEHVLWMQSHGKEVWRITHGWSLCTIRCELGSSNLDWWKQSAAPERTSSEWDQEVHERMQPGRAGMLSAENPERV